MKNKKSHRKHPYPKRVLRLPDLDYAKTAVLNTLSSPDSRRSYRFAIDDFVTWYCSEPRLAFSKTVVLRYRLELEGRHLAPATINLRLAAVRRLAYEAADTGLLSPDLAAGIRRVKGAKKVGVRLGNWLTAEQAKALLDAPNIERVRGRRDGAMLAIMLGCGLRRSELVHLTVDHFQQREDHWAIVDLIGKGGHIRTVPVPDWVKASIDLDYAGAYQHRNAVPLREQNGFNLGQWHHRKGRVECCQRILQPRWASTNWPLTISVAHVPGCAIPRAESWSKFSSCSGTLACRPLSDTWDANSGSAAPSTIA
jgi:integrase